MADSTSPIQQIVAGANAAANINENFDAASPALLFGRNAATTTGLTWGYIGGRYLSTQINTGTVTLTANTTNYVVAAASTGTVSTSTTTTNWNDTANYIRLYSVVVNASNVVTSYQDNRTTVNVPVGGSVGLPGYNFTIDTSSTADADPGAGLLRFNNATQGSATVLFIDNQTADAISLTTLYASLAQTGFMTLSSASDPTKWRVYKITAITSATGYYKFTVVSQAGNAAFANLDSVRVLIDSDANTGGAAEFRGLTFTSDTSSTADSDPGNGVFKWNNATQASATTLYFDNQTADGVSVTSFEASLNVGGFLYLQQGDDSTRWQVWKLSSVVAGSGYYKLGVVLQAISASAIATGKTCYAVFDQGDDLDCIPIACSDETTALTTGAKVTFHMDSDQTLVDIFGGLTTVQTSGSIFRVDITKNGSSIFSTKLTIDNTEDTSLTAATPPVLSTTSFSRGDKVVVSVDQIGDGTAKGLKVYPRWRKP